jgi:hypothetical protein
MCVYHVLRSVNSFQLMMAGFPSNIISYAGPHIPEDAYLAILSLSFET